MNDDTIEDYVEDDAQLHRHTVEELAAWLKALGMKVVDKHGDRVSLETVASIAELAESTRQLRERVIHVEHENKQLRAGAKVAPNGELLVWGKTYSMDVLREPDTEEADSEPASEALSDIPAISIRRLDEE